MNFQIFSINCPFKFFFGIPCPGCGMMRSFLSLLKLDFKKAFAYHPLWPLVILVAGLYILKWIFYRNNDLIIDPKIKNIIIFCIVFIFILVYVIRIVLNDPIVTPDINSGFIYMVINNIIKNVR